MSRILVGYDGTASGRRALELAAQEARARHARLTVLSVVELPLDPSVPRAYGTLDDISPEEGEALHAPPATVEHLTEARGLLAAVGVDADLVWAAGEPAAEIVDTAKRLNARAIVIGERHHQLLTRLFGGDVDGEVQREAGCTVILA
jgi:nucleotide-binding universal stress UspA family protein